MCKVKCPCTVSIFDHFKYSLLLCSLYSLLHYLRVTHVALIIELIYFEHKILSLVEIVGLQNIWRESALEPVGLMLCS